MSPAASPADSAAGVDYEPMKATLWKEPFSDPAWVFERKLDGERCGALRRKGRVRLLSRTGHEMGASYPEIAQALAGDRPGPARRRRIVAFDRGTTSFERLQRRMQIRDPELGGWQPRAGLLLRVRPARAGRRGPARAAAAGAQSEAQKRVDLRWSAAIHELPRREGEAAFQLACQRGWEGVIAKRADSPYTCRSARATG